MKFFLFLLFSFLFLHQFAQVNLTQGLMAHYPFDGNANDVSGNNNNPVFNNATLTADRFGFANKAYHFNGTNTYMKVLNSATLNTSNKMTIAVWVKPTGYYTGLCRNSMLVMKGDADFLPGNYSLRFADPALGCTNTNPTQEIFYGMNAVAYNPIVQLNQWYSVIATYDGTTSKIYVNCQLRDSVASSITSFTNNFDLYIGHLNNATYPYWFNGDLDDVRIYNRAINKDEVDAIGGCTQATTSCNNWLSLPTQGSLATVGDVDVSGTQVTIEANVNRAQAFNSGLYPGHLVSKHTNQNDDNYSLFPNGCALATSNGYFSTFETCPLLVDKNYHVAMVYNGATLKFYRNGFLMSSVPCAGNLILNDLPTTIGQISGGANLNINQLLGYVNEVRIWNVARTQSQIQQYMNTSLPNPTTQTGLQAYYIFNNLQNKQGNAAFNGTLVGGASINATNSVCNYVADSCATSKIINDYTPIVNYSICRNSLQVEDASAFKVGDTVLMIQMKGAVIDSTNSAAFGTVLDYKSAGNYEFNYVKNIVGNNVELKNKIIRTYEIPQGKVQLIRVPYFINYTVTDTLTCLPWDGSKGGVLVFNVQNTLTLNSPIDVSGRGFKGGTGDNSSMLVTNCQTNHFSYPNGTIIAARKGESIAEVLVDKQSGKAPLAGAGGGGLDHNSGGGGGSNGGAGGFGGYQLIECTGSIFDNRGIGGKLIQYNNTTDKVFLGSGGGAGHCNNGTTGVNANYSGGNGGGIAIINATNITGNTNKVNANGAIPYEIQQSASYTHDGMGGGGAGGSILINATNGYSSSVEFNSKGARGGNMYGPLVGGTIGPGGGGGGGIVWLNQSTLPSQINNSVTGGQNGIIIANNATHGSTPGQSGQTLFNLVLPIATVPFVGAIDSFKINETLTGCKQFNFSGIAFPANTNVAQWSWNFGDGITANTQNLTHTYANFGSYTVKLYITDVNGCIDSVQKIVSSAFASTISPNTTICHNSNTQLSATGGTNYVWSPITGLSNANIANPIANPAITTKYYVTVTNGACSKIDSVTITVNAKPVFGLMVSKDIFCKNETAQFTASGGNIYNWTPSTGLSNANLANPIAAPNSTTTYQVQIISSQCNDTTVLSKMLTISPSPNLVVTKSNDIDCKTVFAQLNATGADNYTWTPTTGLSNATIANPTATVTANTTYTLVGITNIGCKDSTTIAVNVANTGTPLLLVPNAFSPNGDGVNDCFGIKHFQGYTIQEFSIFNRWGQRVFFTTNPNACWDGRYRGKLLDNAAFVYQIKATSFCGSYYRKGTLVLTK